MYRFECANCGLAYIEPTTFDAMPAMTRLNLGRNMLDSIPKGLLKSLSSLRELDLSDNRIPNLETDTLRGASSLTKLNLAGNPLVSLSVTPFLITPTLQRLDVSKCNLERVWSDTKVPFESLR